jgi:Holliday junction resolvase RusA-like endonuclease
MEFHRVIHIDLQPMPRPRVNRRGGVGFPARYRMHLSQLREHLAELAPVGAVALHVVIAKKRDPAGRSFGDIDNLLKTLLEALPFDDSRVVEVYAAKRYSVAPYVAITAREVKR